MIRSPSVVLIVLLAGSSSLAAHHEQESASRTESTSRPGASEDLDIDFQMEGLSEILEEEENENGLIEGLLELALYALAIAAGIAFTVWRIIKMQKAAKAPLTDNECVACGSKNVTKIADGVYRCTDCGYEGGSGAARARAAEQQARIDAMYSGDREASGAQDLRQARNLLLSVLSGLDAATPGTSSVEYARTEIVQAEYLLRQAAMKLGDQAAAPPQEPDDGEQFAVATASDALGGVAARMASAAQSSEMRKKAAALLDLAEEALKRRGVKQGG